MEETISRTNPEEIVFSQYYLLRNILQHLSMSDLRSMACTSTRCNEAAAVTMKERWQGPQEFYWSTNVWKENLSEYTTHLQTDLLEHMRRLQMVPSAAIYFLPLHPINWIHFVDPDLEWSSIVGGILPRAFPAVSVHAVITTKEMECLQPDQIFLRGVFQFQPSISMMFFGRSDHYQVVPFSVKTKRWQHRAKQLLKGHGFSRRRSLTCTFAGMLPDPSTIKCVIVLTTSRDISRVKDTLHEIGLESSENAAIGGIVGALARASFDSEQDKSPYCSTTGLIFAGDGVRAASLVLEEHSEDEEEAELRLLELKRANLCEENSCAFMFASFKRREVKNVESKVFRKLFPGTPLIGLFGLYVVGNSFMPKEEAVWDADDEAFFDANEERIEREDQFEDALQKESLRHRHTTVFVLLSFANKSVWAS